MSETFTDAGVTVRFDVAATRRLYAAKPRGEADGCTCKFCRNFILQRATAYPQEFVALLERLGVDPFKENEPIGFAMPDSVSQAFYFASFDFIGAIDAELPASLDTTRGAFTHRFKTGPDYSRGQMLADDLGAGPVASVHATMWLPWMLAGEPVGNGPRDRTIASAGSVRGVSYGFLLGRIALRCATYIRSLLGAAPR